MAESWTIITATSSLKKLGCLANHVTGQKCCSLSQRPLKLRGDDDLASIYTGVLYARAQVARPVWLEALEGEKIEDWAKMYRCGRSGCTSKALYGCLALEWQTSNYFGDPLWWHSSASVGLMLLMKMVLLFRFIVLEDWGTEPDKDLSWQCQTGCTYPLCLASYISDSENIWVRFFFQETGKFKSHLEHFFFFFFHMRVGLHMQLLCRNVIIAS